MHVEAACDYSVRKTLEQDGLCVPQLWGIRAIFPKPPPSLPIYPGSSCGPFGSSSSICRDEICTAVKIIKRKNYSASGRKHCVRTWAGTEYLKWKHCLCYQTKSWFPWALSSANRPTQIDISILPYMFLPWILFGLQACILPPTTDIYYD